MTYFVVHVQTNFEKQVMRYLSDVLLRKKVNIVKSIFALDSKIEFKQSFNDLDIREHLKQSRVRNYLNHSRYSNFYLKVEKEEIGEKNQTLDTLPSRSEMIHSFIRGYIIIELNGNFQNLPSDLYHDIKSIPRVISIPSRHNVPEQEIKFYFNRIEQLNMKMAY